MEKKADPVIERYLLRNLSREELQAFETRLAAEPELVAELAFFEALWLHRDRQAKSRWIDKGRSLLHEAAQPQGVSSAETTLRPVRSANPYRWAIAATFALLVAAAGFWYLNREQNPNESLYSAQYERLSSSNVLGSTEEPAGKKAWDRAFESYSSKNYGQALQEVRALSGSADYANQAHLLAGACYLEQNQTNEAIAEFQQVQRAALSMYSKAQYNIALAYLRAGDVQAAKTQLLQISRDEENTFGGKARGLLGKLSSQ